MQMGKKVHEDASSVLLLCRPQPGIVVDVTIIVCTYLMLCPPATRLSSVPAVHPPTAASSATNSGRCADTDGEPKTAAEAAVVPFRAVCGSWPYT